ncbi:SLC26A/SulP transporter family protein [Magnetospirillum sp. LM-5]|uniref:SLC26A/SulP transporter family protein n=1 Tax=Magnetospirillum sp. LM-5 TaxID=2681466 RepID=UPI00156E198F|nr:SLC26A/SulP transporter family protein [Magnetospirillum sp. LM-5]
MPLCRANLPGDLNGGLNVAILSLPITIPLGALAFAPLGPEFIQAGVVAGFQTSIVGGIVAALTGGCRLQVSGPRASASLMLAAILAMALNDPALAGLGVDTPQAAIMAAFIATFAAGLIQVGLGLARVGRGIKYVPHPVLSGFMNSVALMILVGQLPAALGLDGVKPSQLLHRLGDIRPGAILVTLGTMAAMYLATKKKSKLPPIAVAFAAGTLLHYLLAVVPGGPAMGGLVGQVPAQWPSPYALAEAVSLSWTAQGTQLVLHLLPSSLVLALICSIEALFSAAAVDAVTGGRHDGNRELIGQGLGNIAAACFGGFAGTGAPMRGIASFKAGGRTRLAGVFHSLILLALLIWGGSLLADLSFAVMAGIMMMIAVNMADSWAVNAMRHGGRSFVADFAVMAVVAGISVSVNLPAGVAAGVGIAMIMFVMRMSRPIVRRVLDRRNTRSLRVRPLHVERRLQEEGGRLLLLELDGPLFFGTAESLRDKIDGLVSGKPRVIILDLRRVPDIDSSGVRVLQQTARAVALKGASLALAGLISDSARAGWLRKSGLADAIPESHWYATRDLALEAAEDLLAGDDAAAAHAHPLLSGLDPEAIDHLTERMTLLVLQDGGVVFRRGDAGDGLFLVETGFVAITLPGTPGQPPVRLALFGPGTFFGEMALLDGGPRSADAMAQGEAVAWRLTTDDFHAFRHTHPADATRLLLNLGHELSERLRLTNTRLQAVE